MAGICLSFVGDHKSHPSACADGNDSLANRVAPAVLVCAHLAMLPSQENPNEEARSKRPVFSGSC